MPLRWVRKHERVIDPADPDLRTVAAVFYALGLRVTFDLAPRQIEWAGPWRLNPVGTWQRFGFYTDNFEEVYREVRLDQEVKDG